jgi:hypothetical protein
MLPFCPSTPFFISTPLFQQQITRFAQLLTYAQTHH